MPAAQILIIEDEATIQLLLRELLDSSRYELLFAASVAEARARIATASGIEAALIDKNLPDGSGLSVIPDLVAGHPDAESIVMTGYASVDSAIEAVQLKVFDYITKPFDPGRLVFALQNAVEKVALKREQRRLHDQLARSEERYALAAEASNDGLWDWNLVTGELYLSPRWWNLLGYAEPPATCTPDDWFGRIHEEDVGRVRYALTEHLDGRTPHFEVEYRALDASAGQRWILNRGRAVRDADGRAVRVAGSHADVTARRLAEERLRHDALHDSLTGLPNQSLFRDRLSVVLRKARRQPDSQAAVLFLDLDRFKNVNDSLGHLVGDRLLVAIARRLQGCLRSTDTCARLGGDEFAILLDDLKGLAEAEHVAGRLRAALEPPFFLEGHEVFASASMGIAMCGADDDPEDVLCAADTAMYRAKARGKGRYEVFEVAMYEGPKRFLQTETDLRRALERREITVVYQPIVSLSTGAIAGFEALVRWTNPARGEVAPAEFINVAEETGDIVAIGAWVLREACANMAAWQREVPGASGLFLTVNVSRRQLVRAELPNEVADVLAEVGLDPTSLKLEVTESALVEDLEAAADVLKRLREMRVGLALDDFGTGYSSLSFLHGLPFDTLKIDRSFVMRMRAEADKADVVGTILLLARNLGMNAVAEGIETAEQADELRRLKCPYGQGFYFARPFTPDDVVVALRERGDLGRRSLERLRAMDEVARPLGRKSVRARRRRPA